MTVLQQQCLLLYLGYNPGVVDGVDGPKTQAAMAAFRADYGEDAELLDAVCGEISKVEKPRDFWETVRYFKRSEFRCKCGGRYCSGYPAEMQEAVVKIADDAREHFGRPAHVVSGLRCDRWNAIQGGVANSQHMHGEAIDLRIEGVAAQELLVWVKARPGCRYAYAINSTNVHFDIPPVGR